MLRLVVTVFPELSRAHTSLGAANAKAGDKPRAIAEYEQALRAIDADPRMPAFMKADGRRHVEAQLAKLRAD